MNALLKLLFPPKCVLCRAALTENENAAICPACAAQVRSRYLVSGGVHVPETDGAAAALQYKGVVRDAMHRYKFCRAKRCGTWFAAHTAATLAKQPWKPTVLTYVPIGFLRLRTRGYNQSEIIARQVAALLDIPCEAMLRKRRFVARQSEQNAADRWENARQSFVIRKDAEIAGRRIVLLDDVLTTGATLAACAKCLHEAGAARVYALAVTKTSQNGVRKL